MSESYIIQQNKQEFMDVNITLFSRAVEGGSGVVGMGLAYTREGGIY